jgi:hypothetical protein
MKLSGASAEEMTRPPRPLKALLWLLIGGLAAALAYTAFRGYFNAELLIGFANGFVC